MAGTLAAGTILQLDSGSGLTTIAGIQSIGGPDISVDEVDVSQLTSPNVFKEKLPGWGDGGTVAMECIMTAAVFATLYGTIRVSKPWRIVFSQGSIFDFNGFITSLKLDAPLTEEITVPFSVAITGKPVFTQ